MNAARSDARKAYRWSDRRPHWWLMGVAAILMVAVVGMAIRMNWVPADLDLRTEKASARGVYVVRYEAPEPIPLHALHSWIVWVHDVDGAPVTRARITVDGDMPQHGHGLPTRPVVTREIGDGGYLVEGMKFQMGGWWYASFEVDAERGVDSVRFDLLLGDR